jgi:N-acetylneuraminic acid mutarotase
VNDAGTQSVVVLFGGLDPAAPLGDTWLWNGKSWTQLKTSGPGARSGASMVPLNGTVFLTGGQAPGNPYLVYETDAWTFNGTSWVRQNDSLALTGFAGAIAALGGSVVGVEQYGIEQWDGKSSAGWTGQTIPGPGGRTDAAIATFNGKVVLFGGQDERGTIFGDTWTWDGISWTQLTVTGPSARYGASMATLGSAVVLFGGSSNLSVFGDTWLWNGTSWRQLPVTGPSPRQWQSMAALNGTIVLFGGYDHDDTWTWDGTYWTQQNVAGPPARYHAAMATFGGQ